ERDAAQRVELADFAAALSPRLDEVAVLVELGDARVAGARRRAVGDVDVAVLVPRDACGAHEAVARNARSRRPGRTASAAATAGWRLSSSRRAAARRFGGRSAAALPRGPAASRRRTDRDRFRLAAQHQQNAAVLIELDHVARSLIDHPDVVLRIDF